MSGIYKPRTSAGVHSMVACSRQTADKGAPYGMIQIIKSADPAFDRESIELFGGSNPMSWDSIDGNISNEISITLAEFKPFLYELAGFTKTQSLVAEANGSVTAMTNLVGTSLTNATTGMTVALASGGAANLKRGRYLVKAASTSTIDVYALNNNDFLRGTELAYIDDFMKITSAAITPASATSIPNTGLTCSKGLGTFGVTAGDMAFFEVLTPNLGYYRYSLPANPVPIEFDLWLISQKKANGEYFIDRYPRVKFSAVPGDMNEKAWTETQIAIKVMYDSALKTSYIREDQIITLY